MPKGSSLRQPIRGSSNAGPRGRSEDRCAEAASRYKDSFVLWNGQCPWRAPSLRASPADTAPPCPCHRACRDWLRPHTGKRWGKDPRAAQIARYQVANVNRDGRLPSRPPTDDFGVREQSAGWTPAFLLLPPVGGTASSQSPGPTLRVGAAWAGWNDNNTLFVWCFVLFKVYLCVFSVNPIKLHNPSCSCLDSYQYAILSKGKDTLFAKEETQLAQ